MKILEISPSSYETFIGIVTLGKMKTIRKRIVHYLGDKDITVLDAGCGSGGILEELFNTNERIEISCIDKSNEMLQIIKQKFSEKIENEKLHVINGDLLDYRITCNKSKYDAIINTHILSEIEPEFINSLLEKYNSFLNEDGLIFIADELAPVSGLKRILFYLLRIPLDFISYLIDKHKEIKSKSVLKMFLYYLLELPLIIFSYFPNAPITRPLINIERKLQQSGFDIIEQIKFQFDTFGLYVARKR